MRSETHRQYVPPRYRVIFYEDRDPLVEIAVKKNGRRDHWRTATQSNLIQRVISDASDIIARAAGAPL